MIISHLKAYLVFIAISMLVFNSSTAQSLTDKNWYFGNSDQYLRFSKDSDSVLLKTEKVTPYGTGGGITVNEETTGDILFYSDGVSIFDSENNLITNSLEGDNAINQAATVFSNQDGSFTIFTNDGISGTNGIRRTVVRKGAGTYTENTTQLNDTEISVPTENQATILTNPTNSMLIVTTRRGNNYLISQDSASHRVIVAEIDVDGNLLADTTEYVIFNDSLISYEVGNFSFHLGSSLLALSPVNASRNILILNLNDSTGDLSFNSVVPNSANTDNGGTAIYDTEWSPDGTKLYWSRFGSGGGTANAGLYQYNLADSSTNAVIGNNLSRSFGLQLGPDSIIYHLYQRNASGDIQIGAINNPNAIASNIMYEPVAFADANSFDANQFPVTNKSIFSGFTRLSFSVADTCFAENTAGSNATTFFADIEPTPSSVRWDFGEGPGSDAYSPVFTYSGPGSYTVRLTAELNDSIQVFERTVNILGNDAMLDIGVDTTICPGEEVIMDATIEGESGVTYAWSTGETTPQITAADSTKNYWVAVMFPDGCTLYDQRMVTVYGDTTQAGTIWYFGERAGLDFRESSPPTALPDDNIMSSVEGAAVISDEQDVLQFYTNGQTVWNKKHEVMLNGTDIGGDPNSTQSALIIKAPRGDDETQYYVFTTSAAEDGSAFALKYSLVDMKLDSAKGAVVEKDVLLFDNSTEKLTATGFEDNPWLIAHEYGNAVYRAYPITDEGIGSPALSDVGSTHSFDQLSSARGYLRYSAEANAIAAAIPGEENILEILDFDVMTGEISTPVTIDIGQPGQTIYGIEFSGDGEKLYATANGSRSELIEFDIDSLQGEDPVTDILGSKKIVESSEDNFGALQRGPRGTVYMAIEDASTIGSISVGEDGMSTLNISIDLGGRTSKLGLPNFTQDISSPPPQPGISIAEACFGTETILSGTGTSDIDMFLWTFGDGESADVEDTTHVYNIAQDYNVTLNITNRCGLDTTFFQTITIDSLPIAPDLPANDFICATESITLEALPEDMAADLLFSWSTGETTRTISVSDLGNYSVTISDTLGCSSSPDTVTVFDGRPFLDLENDRFACQNEEIAALNDQNSPPKIRRWFIDDVFTGNITSSQEINTSIIGEFEYKVELEDEVSNCVSIDSIIVTVGRVPTGIFSSSPTLSCSDSSGVVRFEIDRPNSEAYSYTISTIDGTVIRPNTTYNNVADSVINLPANNYVIDISDAITGCDTTVVLPVQETNPNFNFNLSQSGKCEPNLDINVALNILRDTLPEIDISVISSDGINITPTNPTRIDTATNISLLAQFGTQLTPSRYDVTITHNECTISDNIVISADPDVNVSYDPIQNFCPPAGGSEEIQYTIPGVDKSLLQFMWFTGAGTTLGTDSVQSVSSSGNYVIATTPDPTLNLCPSSDTMEVVINIKPNVSIVASGDPCEGRLDLTATFNPVPADLTDYTFQWKLLDNSPFIGGQTITVEEDGLDSLTAFNALTSCIVEAEITVDVHTPVSAFIAVDQNCDNDPNVTLTGLTNITTDFVSSWLVGNVSANRDNQNTLVAEESNRYTYRVTDTINNCMGSDSVDITIMPLELPPNVFIPKDVFICSLDPSDNGNFTYNNLPGEFTYTWSLSNSDSIISRANPFTVNSGGNYKVEITNGFDCLEFISKVTDNCLPRIVAPNAFSPDANGINDVFSVVPNDYVDKFEIFIYNRWGELVFKSDDINFEWNGQLSGGGTELPVGNYAYKMEFTSSLVPNAGIIEQRGGVALIK